MIRMLNRLLRRWPRRRIRQPLPRTPGPAAPMRLSFDGRVVRLRLPEGRC